VAVEFQTALPVTTLFAPVFVVSVALEWWAVKTGRAKGRYETKDAITSMAMGLGNVAVNALTAGIFTAMMMAFWPYRIADVPVAVWSFVAVFVLYDFIYYWKHRFAHRVRWWWMEHVTHHSSTHYNLSTALRQPWFGPLTGLVLVGGPMVLMGFHPSFIAFAAGLNLVYQFWIHTEAVGRMPGWFEAVFNTPSHHRVHHATNPRYLDANYAGVFIIWDKMFGTFVPELDRDPPVYGTVKPLKSHNPVVVAYHEFAGLLADCARDGFRPWRWMGRAVNGPGWSPDGQHQRSAELKRAFLAAHPEEAGSAGFSKAKGA
jgi:sterol desaturase/sphingolipid hydroxylase (fatty acid hydroxylase superfamily)